MSENTRTIFSAKSKTARQIEIVGGELDELNNRRNAWRNGEAQRIAEEKKIRLANDLEMPTLEDKVDALIKAVKDKDMSAIDEKLAKIKQLKVKHGV